MESDDETTPLVSQPRLIASSTRRSCTTILFGWIGPYYRCIEVVNIFFILSISGLAPLLDQLVRDLSSSQVRYDFSRGASALPIVDPSAPQKPSCVEANTTIDAGSVEALIQQQSALMLLYIKLAGSVPAIFSCLIITSMSDVSGRKLGIVLAMFGATMRNLVYILVYYAQANPMLLLLGALVDGIFGSVFTVLACSFAYIADVSGPSTRAIRFVALQCISSVAVSVVQLSFGYVIKVWGYGTGLWICAVLTLVSFSSTIVFIQDSKPVRNSPKQRLLRTQSSIDLARAEILKAAKSLQVFSREWEQKANKKKLIILFVALILYMVVTLGEASPKNLFLLAPPLCFDSVKLGYYNAATYMLHGVSGVVLVIVFKRCVSDGVIALIATISSLAGKYILAFSSTTALLIIALGVSFAAALVFPMLRALMSTLVTPDFQGTLFAALFSVETVCSTVSDIMLNAIYAATFGIMPGFVFLICAIFTTITAILVGVYLCLEWQSRTLPAILTSQAVDDGQGPSSSDCDSDTSYGATKTRRVQKKNQKPPIRRSHSLSATLIPISEDLEYEDSIKKMFI